MLKLLKQSTLTACRHLGLLRMMASSSWRHRRLLILCYHGLALKDEHQWEPLLYVTPAHFRRRMEMIADGGFTVLHLDSAIGMLKNGALPPKSIVITFDDGFYDFYEVAFPALQEFGFPATVYQTTYYADHRFPIFNLVVNYIFWRAHRRTFDTGKFGLRQSFDLSKLAGREYATNAFRTFARDHFYTPAQKDALAAGIAAELGVDYDEIRSLRMLQLMTAVEITEVSERGIDIQLHTHRHRTPHDAKLFTREIRDNREWIRTRIGRQPSHFCYPSGIYRHEFLPWLREENIASAATCEIGLAAKDCNPLLLPRLSDSANLSEAEFDGWLAGVNSFLPRRRLPRPMTSL